VIVSRVRIVLWFLSRVSMLATGVDIEVKDARCGEYHC